MGTDRWTTCSHCGGTGTVTDDVFGTENCDVCDGTGHVWGVVGYWSRTGGQAFSLELLSCYEISEAAAEDLREIARTLASLFQSHALRLSEREHRAWLDRREQDG